MPACPFILDDLGTQRDTLIADVDATGAGDQSLDLLLFLAAEGAAACDGGGFSVSAHSALLREIVICESNDWSLR